MKGYDFNGFAHSPSEFPSSVKKWYFTLYDNSDVEMRFRTTQIVNTADVQDISIEKRQCRFSDERWPLNASLPYNFQSCLIYTRVQIDLDLCNCTLHFAPIEYANQYCNHKQMECIKKHTTKYIANAQMIYKPCLSTCTEMNIDLVGKKRVYEKSRNVSSLTIEVLNQPTKLVRNVSYTNLDLVVTIGKLVG
ncbi:pickpocket protein 19-like [Contarinia nasturtii]|uniref:pickpocket protein 19-like n=1 Tax=Contarinia nasturtii TaxID=265458 RepID=UPI0012D38022|nr:pickpocket protein 19-like [Contarinia nasturtii]